MGFFSQEITAPNFWHYAYPHQAQIQQAQYESQIGAYNQYMNSLWSQWGEYANVVSQTTEGLQNAYRNAWSKDSDAFKEQQAAIDAAYDAQSENLLRTYKQQKKDLSEQTTATKKRTSADLSFRGLGNTTTRNQLTNKIQEQSDELQSQYDEAYTTQKGNLEAQKAEWQSSFSRYWNESKKQAKDQMLAQVAGLQQDLIYRQPLQMDPGPQLTGDYLSNLVNMAQQAQDKDVVVGEEGGWGALALTGLGAGIGALFGPAGMMMGAGLGMGLGGGLEAAFGAPGYQQQGMQSMISGLSSAAMIGMNPSSQFSWGSPSYSTLGAGAVEGQWGGTPWMPGHGPEGYQSGQEFAAWNAYNADPYISGQLTGPANPYAWYQR